MINLDKKDLIIRTNGTGHPCVKCLYLIPNMMEKNIGSSKLLKQKNRKLRMIWAMMCAGNVLSQ